MLGRVKYHIAIVQFSEPHHRCAGLCFWISRTPIQQRSFAIHPKLMLQQNIACVLDKRMNNLQIHGGGDLSSTRKSFPPIFGFELSHAEPAFRSQQSGTLVS
ncbi:hypothetical protein MAXJ12_24257 [Mesorhizobium alhagi CCNWXJ12-2]|uniref:Uncharacterized protein n=1 Tax=Mesorhizobium alhagi CCNWXJ12-2 TaxID=1107882 RepID=H0HXD2_9HYPH|nr:hypothetical protein MAXJ12_24257 [Mesorhizobium alhagi CCNWXJ12-2]